MELRIVIPDAHAPRVLTAFAEHFGYQATIDGQPNPQTEAQFARDQVKAWIRETVRSHEINTATDEAREAAVAAADDVAF